MLHLLPGEGGTVAYCAAADRLADRSMTALAEGGANMAEAQLLATLGRLDEIGETVPHFPDDNVILRVLGASRDRIYLANHSLGRPLDAMEDDVRDGLAVEDDISFTFLDSEKEDYLELYELVVPKLVPGGLLVADNVELELRAEPDVVCTVTVMFGTTKEIRKKRTPLPMKNMKIG